jgi:hypothetical protein
MDLLSYDDMTVFLGCPSFEWMIFCVIRQKYSTLSLKKFEKFDINKDILCKGVRRLHKSAKCMVKFIHMAFNGMAKKGFERMAKKAFERMAKEGMHIKVPFAQWCEKLFASPEMMAKEGMDIKGSFAQWCKKLVASPEIKGWVRHNNAWCSKSLCLTGVIEHLITMVQTLHVDPCYVIHDNKFFPSCTYNQMHVVLPRVSFLTKKEEGMRFPE